MDQLLQCIFSGNAGSTGNLTDYQLQQLASESGISVDQLGKALSSANQASLQAAWQAAGRANAKYPVPPLNAPDTPGISIPGVSGKKGGITMGTGAAIALPIVGVFIAGIAFFFLRGSASGAADIGTGTKLVFGLSLVLFITSMISAVALGANTLSTSKAEPPETEISSARRHMVLSLFQWYLSSAQSVWATSTELQIRHLELIHF
jgi:hypothetical protein